jgi:hypothetical protein
VTAVRVWTADGGYTLGHPPVRPRGFPPSYPGWDPFVGGDPLDPPGGGPTSRCWKRGRKVGVGPDARNVGQPAASAWCMAPSERRSAPAPDLLVGGTASVPQPVGGLPGPVPPIESSNVTCQPHLGHFRAVRGIRYLHRGHGSRPRLTSRLVLDQRPDFAQPVMARPYPTQGPGTPLTISAVCSVQPQKRQRASARGMRLPHRGQGCERPIMSFLINDQTLRAAEIRRRIRPSYSLGDEDATGTLSLWWVVG